MCAGGSPKYGFSCEEPSGAGSGQPSVTFYLDGAHTPASTAECAAWFHGASCSLDAAPKEPPGGIRCHYPRCVSLVMCHLVLRAEQLGKGAHFYRERQGRILSCLSSKGFAPSATFLVALYW